MRSMGGLGYLLIIALIGIAIDRMAVTLYDAGSVYRHDLTATWSSASAKAPATPARDAACAKPGSNDAAADGTGHACPATLAMPAAPERNPLDSVGDLWAVFRRL